MSIMKRKKPSERQRELKWKRSERRSVRSVRRGRKLARDHDLVTGEIDLVTGEIETGIEIESEIATETGKEIVTETGIEIEIELDVAEAGRDEGHAVGIGADDLVVGTATPTDVVAGAEIEEKEIGEGQGPEIGRDHPEIEIEKGEDPVRGMEIRGRVHELGVGIETAIEIAIEIGTGETEVGIAAVEIEAKTEITREETVKIGRMMNTKIKVLLKMATKLKVIVMTLLACCSCFLFNLTSQYYQAKHD